MDISQEDLEPQGADEGEEEAEAVKQGSASSKNKKKKKKAGTGEQKSFMGQSLKNQIVPALIAWQGTGPLPASLNVNDENKKTLAELLVNVPDWGSFVRKEYADQFTIATAKAEERSKRLSHPLDTIEEYKRDYYAKMVDDILRLKSDPETPWPMLQAMMLKWENAKSETVGSDKLQSSEHECFSEMMRYFDRTKATFPIDDIEAARQQALAGAAQEEDRLLMEKLTLDVLITLVIAKETQLDPNVPHLEDRDIEDLIAACKKGNKQRRQALQYFIRARSEIPADELQKQLKGSPLWHAFLKEQVEKESDRRTSAQKNN